MNRAKSVKHAEYEILNQILIGVPIDDLEFSLVPNNDKVAQKRFDTAAKNVCKVIENMKLKRIPYLPDDHPDKEDSK